MQENVNRPDSTITTNLSFRNLVLMNMQQLTNFPYIEKDFDALIDYELLSLVVKFLNDVIANQNEQNDSITRMYESFLALQTYVNNTKDTLETAFNNLDDYVRNYFDNLDVQDEINNKLDKMLEDGVLEQIIEQFLQSTAIWCFDTVADMKAATNLIDGSYAKTLGYHSINDGGGAIYKIRKITNDDVVDEMTIIAINDNSLVAELILKNTNNPEMFGAYGDGVHNDTDSLKCAINNSKRIIGNKTYLVGHTNTIEDVFTINNPINIKLNKIIDNRTYLTTVNNNQKAVFKILSDNVTIETSIESLNDLPVDSSESSNNLSEVGGYGIIIDECNNLDIKLTVKKLNGIKGEYAENSKIKVNANWSAYPYAIKISSICSINITSDSSHRAYWGSAEYCDIIIKSKNFYSTGDSSHVLFTARTLNEKTYLCHNNKILIIDTGTTITNDNAAYITWVNETETVCDISSSIELIGDISSTNNFAFSLLSSNDIIGTINMVNSMKIEQNYSTRFNRWYNGVNLNLKNNVYDKLVIDTTKVIDVNLEGLNQIQGAVQITNIGQGSHMYINNYFSLQISSSISSGSYTNYVIGNVREFPTDKISRFRATKYDNYFNGVIQ